MDFRLFSFSASLRSIYHLFIADFHTAYSHNVLCLSVSFRSFVRSFVFFSGIAGFKCPVCNKFVLPDEIECHLVMCLTKPRLSYNGESFGGGWVLLWSWFFNENSHQFTEDVLTDAKGECVICLDELNSGDVIARLPCLCIYHKR